MHPETTEDIYSLLSAYRLSAATGAALERGLFWLIADRPMGVDAIAETLSIPEGRCRYWLALLAESGLLADSPGGYSASPAARASIIDAHTPETWAFLAEEARQRMPAFVDLVDRLPSGAAGPQHDYVERMNEDAGEAARFTRMLAELHRDFADAVAAHIDLEGARRVMDLGGGSGALARALLRAHPDVEAVVVDIANVCAAGRAMAGDSPEADRIRYHAADFTKDPLPAGFDVVIECDVGVYGEAVLRGIHEALNPGGRLVIVDLLAPAMGVAPPQRTGWALAASLYDADFRYDTADELVARLEGVGFALERRAVVRGEWTLIEVRRGS